MALDAQDAVEQAPCRRAFKVVGRRRDRAGRCSRSRRGHALPLRRGAPREIVLGSAQEPISTCGDPARARRGRCSAGRASSSISDKAVFERDRSSTVATRSSQAIDPRAPLDRIVVVERWIGAALASTRLIDCGARLPTSAAASTTVTTPSTVVRVSLRPGEREQRLRRRRPEVVAWRRAVVRASSCYGRNEILGNGAADAAVGEFTNRPRHGLSGAVLHQPAVETDLAELVDNHANAFALVCVSNERNSVVLPAPEPVMTVTGTRLAILS